MKNIFKKSKETASLVGGSSAFGTGASSDSFTVSSILSKKTNTHFFNLGCSAFLVFKKLFYFNIY
jgi:hypothetical protein